MVKRRQQRRRRPARPYFNPVCGLSLELAEIMGTNKARRSDVVRKIWQIVKKRNLRDPSDRRYHINDDQLMTVFGTRRVRTFSMMKYLENHLHMPYQ